VVVGDGVPETLGAGVPDGPGPPPGPWLTVGVADGR
jgi:hypothetical protein